MVQIHQHPIKVLYFRVEYLLLGKFFKILAPVGHKGSPPLGNRRDFILLFYAVRQPETNLLNWFAAS